MNLSVYRNPYNNKAISETINGEVKGLIDGLGNFFPIVNGYPDFLVNQELTGLNKKYEKFYNKVGRIAGAFEGVFSLFLDFTKIRKE